MPARQARARGDDFALADFFSLLISFFVLFFLFLFCLRVCLLLLYIRVHLLTAIRACGYIYVVSTLSEGRFVRGVLGNAASLQLPLVREGMAGRTLDDWLRVDAVAHACITAEVRMLPALP